ncbi:MFS transporter [Nicoliella spurrieriana]|uniref:MFS transporter n=1 Tax=Nicoliella spurrieriana TaxID=2925830 RepID=A0A976RS51_9LACO|nr:MFS transporter [Nicoliella spurrieriana]UQS86885.1 MFS transporter [Nicoliella spurrieriana]
MSRKWLILICIGIVTFMSDLDASVVNIALPTISKSLSISMSISELIVSAYLITICILLMPLGKLSDKIGKNRIFKIGTALFTVGSLVCGLSPNITLLIFARILQGIGAAMTMSTNNGIITEVFPKKQRGQALGWIGSFVALGMIAGPGVGGVILQYLSWEDIFYINVPVGILMMLMATKVLEKDHPGKPEQSDPIGDALSTAFIFLFFVYLYAGQQFGYLNGWLLLGLLISVVALVVFIFNENKQANPLIDLKLFKNVDFSAGLITAVLIFVTNNFYMVLTPFYLQNARNYSAGIAGLIMMILPFVQIVTAPLSGKLADVFGEIKLIVIGLLFILVAQVLLLSSNLNSSIIIYMVAIGLLGLGNSVFQAPNNSMIMGSIKSKDLGIAGSMNSLSRNIGMVLGNALATSLLFLVMSVISGQHVTNFTGSNKPLYLMGQQFVYGFGIVLIVITIVITLKQVKTIRTTQS